MSRSQVKEHEILSERNSTLSYGENRESLFSLSLNILKQRNGRTYRITTASTRLALGAVARKKSSNLRSGTH